MKTELSHQNHFKFGYGDDFFNFRETPEQIWKVSYGPCSRPALSFRDECFRTAQTIRTKTDQDIWVLFSGGVDSEVALRSFVEQGIPVKVAIARFKFDLNLHDISYAVVVCESLKVPYYFFEIDLLEFWKHQAIEYADRTYCVSPQLLTTMWLTDQVDGYCVLGSGECLLVKQKPDDYVAGVSPYEKSNWELWEKEKIAAWYRHFMVNKKDGCPGFFQFTPEVILSYLQDPFVQKLIHCEIPGKLTTESSKLKIYQQHFNLVDRPKYTGFEKVQAEDAVLRKFLKDRFSFHEQVFKSDCFELIKKLNV